ncbi:TonB family protein [Ferrimonas pelagia]|uniref:Protein TonB n=1 Tax=Ferrimonas pelagia TaxID=1177826 RepID=A0ABP9FF25_9GAMM
MNRLWIFVATMLISLPQHADLSQGLTAYAEDDFATARTEFLALAPLGNEAAIFNLGVMSLYGEGVEKDAVDAYAWFSLAAHWGHPDAKSAQKKVKQVLSPTAQKLAQQKALEYQTAWDKAALQQRLFPQLLTAEQRNSHQSSSPVPARRQNPHYPIELARKGIEGWVVMEFSVAADGSVRDLLITESVPEKAFDKAALQAMKKWRYEFPEGVEQRDHPGQSIRLDFSLSNAVVDENKLDAMLTQYQTGDPSTALLYARVLDHLKITKELPPAHQDIDTTALYQMAAQAGSHYAQRELARRLMNGDTCVQERKKGLNWLQIAAQNGDPQAQYALGSQLLWINDTEQDQNKAHHWLMAAHEQGHPYAGVHLVRLFTLADSEQWHDPKRAIVLGKEMLAQQDTNAELLSALAAAHHQLGETKEAIKWQKRAVKYAKRSGWALEPFEQALTKYQSS